MVDNTCRAGERFADAVSTICRGGTDLTKVCRAGDVVYEVAPANPIVIGSYDATVHPCCVANDPDAGQFTFQLRPNGEIWVGGNYDPLALSTGGGWSDGSVAGADYEVRFTTVSGNDPTFPAVGVWHDLAVIVTAVWDFPAPMGESFNSVHVEIRDKATNTVQGGIIFCKQVGVDVVCQAC